MSTEDPHPAGLVSSGYKRALSSLTAMTGAFGVVATAAGAAWYLVGPRIDEHILGIVNKSQKPTTYAAAGAAGAAATPDLDTTSLKSHFERIDASINGLSKSVGQVQALQQQIDNLSRALSELKAAYGYSFRFSGADLLAQRRPLNKVYFYATREDAVEIDVFLATPKLDIVMKVDGTKVVPPVRDSRQGILITPHLVFTSLSEVIAVRETQVNEAPRSFEDPRPENLHYVEFLPATANLTFDAKTDFDISGIIRVSKLTKLTKKDN